MAGPIVFDSIMEKCAEDYMKNLPHIPYKSSDSEEFCEITAPEKISTFASNFLKMIETRNSKK